MTWFRVEAVGPDDLDSIASRMSFTADIAAPAQRIFEILTTAENQGEWFQDFKEMKWIGLQTEGVGAERIIALKLLSVKERFIVWEPGKRFAFTLFASTLPLVKKMVEDMKLEEDGAVTRLTWTVHYELKIKVLSFAEPLLQKTFGAMFEKSVHGLKRYAERGR